MMAVVADSLLGTPLSDFLDLAENAYAAHLRKADLTAEVYRDIAKYVIPQIYGPELRQKIRQLLNSGKNFLEISTSHKSLIEILVAGVDGRPVMFVDAWKFDSDCPPSKFEFSMEAESGILDEENQKFIEEFEEKLHDALGGHAKNLPDPVSSVNRFLKRRAAREPSVRYFYIYRKGQSRVKNLEERYPPILFFLNNASGHNDDESIIIDCLKCLHCPESHQ